MPGYDFDQRVRNLLRGSGLPFVQEVGIGGAEIDFVVTLGDNRRVALELKAVVSDPSWVEAQAELYEKATSLPVLVVLEGEPSLLGPSGGRYVFETELVARLRQSTRTRQGSAVAQAMIVRRPRIFAAMPFEPSFDDIFDVFLRAADRVGAQVLRVDKTVFNASTLAEVIAGIEGCKFVVADLTGANPNVLYEVGRAHAIDRHSVHVCSSPRRGLPFDVRDQHAIKYEVGRTTAILDELTEHFEIEMR